jgi:lipopolysaccharide/colanic/teichoic acid biosynthesis glycosyltransferase
MALALAYWLRFNWSSIAGLEPRVPDFPVWGMLPFAASFLLAFTLAGVYRRENVVSGLGEYGRIFGASGMTVLMAIVIAYLTRFPVVSRGFVLLSLGLVTLWVCLGRFGVRRMIYRAARRGQYLETTVVVGVNRQAIDAARQLNRSLSASTRVVGFLSDYRTKGSVVADGLRVLGEPLELETVAHNVGANRAVVVESGLAWESLRAIVQVMHGRGDLAISLVPGLSDLHSTSMDARHIGPVLTLNPRPTRIIGAEAVIKRALDIVVVVPALLLGLPLMALMAGAAFVAGQGAGLSTERVEASRRELVLRHFDYPRWAAGAHLSRIPDLWHVLSGRMSLLGPRPITIERTGGYQEALTMLEAAKPGFIGPWWLAGLGRPPDLEQEMAYDLYYLRNYSFWLDLEILLKAVRGLVIHHAAPALRWRADRTTEWPNHGKQRAESKHAADPRQ